MNEKPMTPWLPFWRRRADYCRRLALMQRDPSIAHELRELARHYEAEALIDIEEPLLGVQAT